MARPKRADGPSPRRGPTAMLAGSGRLPPRWPDTGGRATGRAQLPAASVSYDGAVIPRRLSPSRGIAARSIPRVGRRAILTIGLSGSAPRSPGSRSRRCTETGGFPLMLEPTSGGGLPTPIPGVESPPILPTGIDLGGCQDPINGLDFWSNGVSLDTPLRVSGGVDPAPALPAGRAVDPESTRPRGRARFRSAGAS